MSVEKSVCARAWVCGGVGLPCQAISRGTPGLARLVLGLGGPSHFTSLSRIVFLWFCRNAFNFGASHENGSLPHTKGVAILIGRSKLQISPLLAYVRCYITSYIWVVSPHMCEFLLPCICELCLLRYANSHYLAYVSLTGSSTLIWDSKKKKQLLGHCMKP